MDGSIVTTALPRASCPVPARSRIADEIWDMKYRLKTLDGTPIDQTIDDTFRRVATALAEPEQDAGHWADVFFDAMRGFEFIPAGRILSGAGSARRVTLNNCYVSRDIPDSLDGIMDALKEASLTMQQGGGIGFNFSTIRPKGAPVKGVGADASGVLPFADLFDAMCKTIMSAGARRGAMMIMLRCDHPDIWEYVDAKRERGRLRMFNMSVACTDYFMDAVINDLDWDLTFEGKVFKTLRAVDLWNHIMQNTYDHADPGVWFVDRINQRNNLFYCETISACNPCGEQNLPPYGACDLGHVNLARLVRDPFTDKACLDEARLKEIVQVGVRILDNVIDVTNYPLPEQKAEMAAKRRIGLGYTGLADALAMMRVRYGSAEAVRLTRQWGELLQEEAYAASTSLAVQKGSFPLFDKDPFLSGYNVARLKPARRDAIAKFGIRNGVLTSIAPTGTTSLFADNVSSGMEPVFSMEATRKILNPDGSERFEDVSDYACRLYREINGADAPLPDYFISANDLSPADHIAMMAAAQENIDNSISKTVNVAETISFDDLKAVYVMAWDQGCKGCTTFRPNDTTGSVLTTNSTEPPTVADVPVTNDKPQPRPDELQGTTYKLKTADMEHAMYITCNDIIQNGCRRPFEVFINSKNVENFVWVTILTRMISAVFRRSPDVAFVVEEMRAVFDPRGGHWSRGKYVPSIVAAIGDVIERHMVSIGYISPPEPMIVSDAEPNEPALAKPLGAICPSCSQPSLIRQENCSKCTSCLYSKC